MFAIASVHSDNRPALVRSQRAHDGVLPGDGGGGLVPIAHVALQHPESLVRHRQGCGGADQRGDMVTGGQRLVEEVATGAAGRAEDGEVHGGSFHASARLDAFTKGLNREGARYSSQCHAAAASASARKLPTMRSRSSR